MIDTGIYLYFVNCKSACFEEKVHSFTSIVYPPAQLPQRVTDFTIKLVSGRPMQECVSDVNSSMTMTKLQLNDEKTEAMLVMSKRSSTSGPILQSVSIRNSDLVHIETTFVQWHSHSSCPVRQTKRLWSKIHFHMQVLWSGTKFPITPELRNYKPHTKKPSELTHLHALQNFNMLCYSRHTCCSWSTRWVYSL